MKDATWDLGVFYRSFDDPALKADIEALPPLLTACHALPEKNMPPKEILKKMLEYLTRITNLFSRAFSYCQLTLSADTQNREAFRRLDELSTLYVDVEILQNTCIRYVGGLGNLSALIDGDEDLTPYAFFLKDFSVLAAHMLPEDMEKWMLRMSLSGGDAFSKLRDQLMSMHLVEIEGKKLPLPTVRGMAYDPNPAIRKQAYDAELASYEKAALPIAFCLAGIKGEALTLCEAKKYPDILSQQLAESRMDKETLDAMFTAIREALPDFQQYLQAKARYLGHPSGLPFYDLFAPVSQNEQRYTIDEAQTLLTSTFSHIHPEMGAFINRAFEDRWIDVFPKEGKEGGAFCAGNHELKISRILTNFLGSFSDVSTLAHELGHAWHNHCLENVPVLLSDPPMPLAETASIFNETLLNHAIRQAADKETAFSLLESSLMEATQTVVDIYSRFLFESAVFEARKNHTPTPEELCTLMLEAQEQSYGAGLHPEFRHPYMWMNKSHYYTVGLHFYNFPYAFGLLFGLGVFAKYQEQGASFLPRYDALLSRCGSGPVADVAAEVGIDVRSTDYWRSALNVIRGEIDEFISLCEKRI